MQVKDKGKARAKAAYLQRTIDKIVHILSTKKPEQAPYILDALENDDKYSDGGGSSKTHWDSSYSKMSQIPKYWIASKLAEWQPMLTKELLEAMDSVAPEIIRQIAEFATGIDFKHWKLPRAALEKAVLDKAMKGRYIAYGQRLSDEWFEVHCNNANRTIVWSKAGVYSFGSNEESAEDAKFLQNCCGDRKSLNEAGVVFKLDTDILENYSDVKAALRQGWKISADPKLFHGSKYIGSGNFKVFEIECTELAKRTAEAQAAAVSSKSDSALLAIEEGQTTIGQAKRAARKPKASPKTASLLLI